VPVPGRGTVNEERRVAALSLHVSTTCLRPTKSYQQRDYVPIPLASNHCAPGLSNTAPFKRAAGVRVNTGSEWRGGSFWT
jgi:hypothetical protein